MIDRQEDREDRLDPNVEVNTEEALGSEARARSFVKMVLHLDWIVRNKAEIHGPHYNSPFIDSRVEPTYTYTEAIKHIFPQYSVVNAFPPDFIGRLESFHNDWDRLQQVCKFTLKGGFQNGDGFHETNSTHDKFGTYRAMRNLIQEDSKIMRALCLIYYYDFLYFGYSFPSACKDLEPS